MKRLIQKIIPNVASADMRVALAVPALIGVATVIAGCCMEASGQAEIARTHGRLALEVYRAVQDGMQLPFAQWMREGIAGNLFGFGENTQARGFLLTAFAPLISAALVLASRVAHGRHTA
jgi:hypothetical protein